MASSVSHGREFQNDIHCRVKRWWRHERSVSFRCSLTNDNPTRESARPVVRLTSFFAGRKAIRAGEAAPVLVLPALLVKERISQVNDRTKIGEVTSNRCM